MTAKRRVLYSSRFGTTPTGLNLKRHVAWEVEDPSPSRASLRRLAIEASSQHTVVLPGADHAGDSVTEIVENLLFLSGNGKKVWLSQPGLKITRSNGVGKFCAALLKAKRDITRRKKSMSAVVTALLQGKSGKTGRPSKMTEELISKIFTLYSAGMSCRKIAKEITVSRSLVMRILKLKPAAKLGLRTDK